MANSFDALVKRTMSPKARKIADAKTKELLLELELAELRQAAEKTQIKVAKSMRISQAAVAAMEKRSDMYLSTLTRYVESLGGKLHLIAELPNGRQVELSNLSRR
jgi:DNA-binding XRE family transcriptional regulator